MRMLTTLFLWMSSLNFSHAFVHNVHGGFASTLQNHSVMKLRATSDKIKRAKILNRRGQHFLKKSAKIEFGYTTKLDTDLVNSDSDSISQWLSDESRVASGIWDKSKMKKLESNKYRLELMTIQFLTIQLAPSVDVLMWIEKDPVRGDPIFKLESIGYNPNIKIMPGINADSKALGIEIDVVGELRLDSKGTGLSGEIGFVSSGNLLPPMRLFPERAMKGATALINKTISNFAVKSFEKGAKEEYAKFMRENPL